MVVSGVYVAALFCFFILFYLNFTPGEIEDKIHIQKHLEELNKEKDEEKELIHEGHLNEEDIKKLT